MKISGQGLYDSSAKGLRFTCEGGLRMIQADWDDELSAISCKVPPLTWLFGGEEVSPEVLETTRAGPIKIELTLNGQEWMDALTFKYHDCGVTRLAYVTNFGEDLETEEEKEAAWLAPDPAPVPPEEDAEPPTEDELAK